jgi:(1->4)-alpha-D-glucan 1-alpha-D-glucosylmutase
VLPRDPDDSPAAGAPDRREGYAPADLAEAAARLRFAMKFQQYTGPVQAKGLEDTAFYRYNMLLSLNEVGGDPSRFGVSTGEFHEMNRARLAEWPFEMLATSTHDTKLGEDVRTRIDVLSELPDEWGREVARWMRMNRDARAIVDGEPAPDRNDEYRFYQALVGIWPSAPDAAPVPPEVVDRLKAYLTKSVKEAKVFSSWINPNEAYEGALTGFVDRVLTGPVSERFLASLQAFHQRVARVGAVNSLAQTVLKIGSPGVPDFYQGTELWDLTLVDPDNRRPVDFDARVRALDRVDAILAAPPDTRAAALRSLVESSDDGVIKLLVTAAGLRLRSETPALFLEADYVALDVDLTVPAGAVAFARVLHAADGGTGIRAAIVIAPHLAAPLVDAEHALPIGEAWKTSRVLLPPALGALTYRDAFTGAEIKPTSTSSGDWIFVGQALQRLPVAMLLSV